jgi:hypothetical protein
MIIKHASTWIKHDNMIATNSNETVSLPLSTDPTTLTDPTKRSNLNDGSLDEIEP